MGFARLGWTTIVSSICILLLAGGLLTCCRLLHDELSWDQQKVDELLLPIIQKMNKRSQANAMNRQGTLGDFFDVTGGGSGTTALEPRKRQAYTSKRLQELVSAHRNEQKQANTTGLEENESRIEGVGANGGSSATKRKRSGTGKGVTRKRAASGKRNAKEDGRKGEADEGAASEDYASSGRGQGVRRARAQGKRGRGGVRRPVASAAKRRGDGFEGDGSSSGDEFTHHSVNHNIDSSRTMTLRARPHKASVSEADGGGSSGDHGMDVE